MNLISNKINALKTNIFSKYRSRKSKKTIRLKIRKKFKRRCTNKLKITYFEEKNRLINKLFDRWYMDIVEEPRQKDDSFNVTVLMENPIDPNKLVSYEGVIYINETRLG